MTEYSSELTFSSDSDPGISRRRCGKGFTYRSAEGRTICDSAERDRIAALAIPPAWTDVWICSSRRGHLQATGRDAKGRKQYRYHPDWRAQRERDKFDQLLPFSDKLPDLRRAIDADLRSPKLTRTRVLAAAVRLLETSCIRVGNSAYRKRNQTFGLTTLHQRHVELEGQAAIQLQFIGKGGKDHAIRISEERIARVLRRCHDLPGQSLLQYRENGRTHSIDSQAVNDYIKSHTNELATAKTFRIWMGSVYALADLIEAEPTKTQAARKRRFLQAVDAARSALRNTRAVCRRSYLHPAIEQRYLAGDFAQTLDDPPCRASRWLDREEVALRRLIEQNQRRATQGDG